ncbi:MAG: alpha/beta hydrolase [Pseudomonadota bacterium]
MQRIDNRPQLSGLTQWKSQVARQVLPLVIRSSIRPLWGSRVPVVWQRKITEAALRNGWVPRQAVVGETRLGHQRAEVITPRDGSTDQVVFYMHGGGYVVCSPSTHRPLTSRIGLALKATTYVPYYRLAPEHVFPAGLEDALDAYRGLLERGVNPARVALMGDSAGGGLALALALSIRDQGLPLPGKLVLISPFIDLTLSGESLQRNAKADPMLSLDWIYAKTPMYLGSTPADHPLASPLFADLRGLPPTLVQVGTEEILYSDSERLAARAAEIGWDLTLSVWDGLFHDFQMMGGILPEADQAIAEIAAFVKG